MDWKRFSFLGFHRCRFLAYRGLISNFIKNKCKLLMSIFFDNINYYLYMLVFLFLIYLFEFPTHNAYIVKIIWCKYAFGIYLHKIAKVLITFPTLKNKMRSCRILVLQIIGKQRRYLSNGKKNQAPERDCRDLLLPSPGSEFSSPFLLWNPCIRIGYH